MTRRPTNNVPLSENFLDSLPERTVDTVGVSTAVSNDEPAESRLCKVCFENEFNTAFMPCGHVVACTRCASIVERCPMCNQRYTHVLRLHLP
uniref:RING-type domain-containing protein n=1 Tax=Anopheles atroparvus TaxID=41427 RepID=A0AAG5DBJ4_ANOAO